MSFEEDIANLNVYYFFREFTFSKNTFRPTSTEEFELADNIIYLDDILHIYQLKERQAPNSTSPKKEQRWFEQKILGKATKQIRDTLSYLHNHKNIQLQNHRGDIFSFALSPLKFVHKIVLYKSHELLPLSCKQQKHYKSQTGGFIHLISSEDYLGVLQTMLTPIEVSDYLGFREKTVTTWEEDTLNLPEQALVGQYLSGCLNEKPHFQFIEYLYALQHRAEDWDMTGIITVFPERVTTDNAPTDYYHIVKELAKLRRSELQQFKLRFLLSMEKAKANQFVLPYRIAIPRTECGFVFVPLTDNFIEKQLQFLENLTYAHKYDQRLSKCIGVSFTPEEDEWYSVYWCYIDFTWCEDPQMENILQQNNPFREVQNVEVNRYSFGKLRS